MGFKVLPQITEAKVSPKGTLNIEDIKKITKNALIFLSAPLFIYFAQLTASLSNNVVLSFSDLVPNSWTLGAMQGWALSSFIDYLRKLNNGK